MLSASSIFISRERVERLLSLGFQVKRQGSHIRTPLFWYALVYTLPYGPLEGFTVERRWRSRLQTVAWSLSTAGEVFHNWLIGIRIRTLQICKIFQVKKLCVLWFRGRVARMLIYQVAVLFRFFKTLNLASRQCSLSLCIFQYLYVKYTHTRVEYSTICPLSRSNI